jgi:hypothetical protein
MDGSTLSDSRQRTGPRAASQCRIPRLGVERAPGRSDKRGRRIAAAEDMTASSHTKRLILIAAATAAAVAAFAGSANGRLTGVTFVAGNSRVVQGNEATVSVRVSPANARCSLAVRYKSGAKQKGLPSVRASSGLASWTWKVPRLVQPGPARATASCAGAGRASKTFTVIGQVIAPKIHVVKSGWSVRNYPFGGAGVSYGVILANESKTRDALDVKMLVNFVMEDNRLIGSATVRIRGIQAGQEHATGGELRFPGGAPIARLEIVVEVRKSGPATRARPGISAARIMPSPYEPEWAGSTEGEVQNDDPTRTIDTVDLSTVILDAEGNVIGGGSGFAAAALVPAARMFFKISNGMRPIPYYKAATALVSVVPRYRS